MNVTKILAVVCIAAFLAMTYSIVSHETDYTKDLPEYTISGETDLDGNFYISFVYSKNIIMLDGKGNVAWQHTSYLEGDEAETFEMIKKVAAGESLKEEKVEKE